MDGLGSMAFRCDICRRLVGVAAAGRCAKCGKIMCRRHLWGECPGHSLTRQLQGVWQRTVRRIKERH
jgi:hypothetical protein